MPHPLLSTLEVYNLTVCLSPSKCGSLLSSSNIRFCCRSADFNMESVRGAKRERAVSPLSAKVRQSNMVLWLMLQMLSHVVPAGDARVSSHID